MIAPERAPAPDDDTDAWQGTWSNLTHLDGDPQFHVSTNPTFGQAVVIGIALSGLAVVILVASLFSLAHLVRWLHHG